MSLAYLFSFLGNKIVIIFNHPFNLTINILNILKFQVGEFEILNNPSIRFWSTFGQQIGKNTPLFPAYPWVSQKRERDLTV